MLKTFLHDELPLAMFWLIFGLAAGLIYSLELLGMDGSMILISPERARSLHISLMLYGFFPLILSLLPFALFEKEGVLSQEGVSYLRRYFVVWNVFLLFMSMSLLFGKLRGLPFYDFAYDLNFLLAFSGFFYLLALVDALRRYEHRPLWVNVSLAVVVIAPILLIVLMNPDYGQVEKTLIGPHGDNTLGMSFALIPIYYLLIKLNAQRPFIPSKHWLWIIPLGGYVLSLIVRNFSHPLSYNEEWFFQYLTLLYLPLLYFWWRDSGLRFKNNPYLFFSIAAFVFVDVEGNILFVPEIRELVHRNDLVIGHAHIAMGIGVAFMALSIVHRALPGILTKACAIGWSSLISLMAFSLSVAGAIEAGWIDGKAEWFWGLRSLLGGMLIVMVGQILWRLVRKRRMTFLGWYHLIGFMSDFGGGVVLLIAGGWLFGMLGWSFGGTYEYAVFAFMMGTGVAHWMGLEGDGARLAHLTSLIRLSVASAFAALYLADVLGMIAMLVALYDTAYALIYLLWLKERL